MVSKAESENYIINRLFPVPYSNTCTHDHSVVVLGIASVFCVLKFLFVFLPRDAMHPRY